MHRFKPSLPNFFLSLSINFIPYSLSHGSSIIWIFTLCRISIVAIVWPLLSRGENPLQADFRQLSPFPADHGVALLVLAVNYAVHMFCELRFSNPDSAIFMNLSTYYLSAWLFSSALTSLLDRGYLSRRRFLLHIGGWLFFTAVSGGVLLILPAGIPQLTGLIVMAVWFLLYAFRLARRLLRTYHRAVRVVDDFHSDHIAAYIRWLSIFTYWAVVYGIGCGLLTFLPDRYVFLWVLSSIPFYVYLFCSYMNYLLFYEQIESILETEMEEKDVNSVEGNDSIPLRYAAIAKPLTSWIDSGGYTHPGLTIEELAKTLGTNCTYLSSYIKHTYHLSFREWITGLRLEYARRMLTEHPEQTVSEISEASGFLSLSYFTKIFSEKENCSPARWRKMPLENH